MGNFKVRHLIENKSGFYFQPSAVMRRGGFRAEALGKDKAHAIIRVEELNSQWDAIQAGDNTVTPSLPAKGTMDRFIHDLKSSSQYLDKSVRRQEEIDESARIISKVFGPSLLRSITPERAERFYDALRRKGSVHKAHKVIKNFRYLMNRALRQHLIPFNPALGFEVKQPEPRDQQWKPEQVNTAIDTAWEMGLKGLAVGIAIQYDTGLSPVDVRTLTIGQIKGDRVARDRAKTGRSVDLKLWPQTISWIEAYHRDLGVSVVPTALVIRTQRGRPYTKDTYAKDFRKVRAKAGIPDVVQLQDLRRTATTESMEGEATIPQVAAARGWSYKTAAKNLETYGIRSEKLADGANEKRPMNMKGPKV